MVPVSRADVLKPPRGPQIVHYLDLQEESLQRKGRLGRRVARRLLCRRSCWNRLRPLVATVNRAFRFLLGLEYGVTFAGPFTGLAVFGFLSHRRFRCWGPEVSNPPISIFFSAARR